MQRYCIVSVLCIYNKYTCLPQVTWKSGNWNPNPNPNKPKPNCTVADPGIVVLGWVYLNHDQPAYIAAQFKWARCRQTLIAIAGMGRVRFCHPQGQQRQKNNTSLFLSYANCLVRSSVSDVQCLSSFNDQLELLVIKLVCHESLLLATSLKFSLDSTNSV